MAASAHIYPALVRKALDLAGEELRGHRVIGEIMIHGRSVILVRYSWSDDGNRIEADIFLEGKYGIVRQAVVGAGRSIGLQPRRYLQGSLDTKRGRLISAGRRCSPLMVSTARRPSGTAT
jgi:hypothetical protein